MEYIHGYIEELSRGMDCYNNNLDNLLCIKTKNTCRSGIKWNGGCRTAFCEGCKYDHSKTKELSLYENELVINSQDFDWYIVYKEKEYDMFTIIGLFKKDERIGIIYKLGREYNSNTTVLKKDYYGKIEKYMLESYK